MKSIVLCEGPDDLWFIAYYLHKTAGWTVCKANQVWHNYKAAPLNDRQQVQYLRCGDDSTAVWCVGGKDSFRPIVSVIFDRFIKDYSFDPIDAVVIVRDRDYSLIPEVLQEMQGWFPDGVTLANHKSTIWKDEVDGHEVAVHITPVVIPFDEKGAIESLLMESVGERGEEERIIVQEAEQYIERLISKNGNDRKYLSHQRLITKAKYSSVIAVTNPDHSTALFQNMVMACSWEKSPYISKHFGVVLSAITGETLPAPAQPPLVLASSASAPSP